jgi:hypothetical protein
MTPPVFVIASRGEAKAKQSRHCDGFFLSLRAKRSNLAIAFLT